MSGRQTRIGYLVASDPRAAAKALQALFTKHRSVIAVAKAEGVDRHTVCRWLAGLPAGVVVDRPKVVGGRPRTKKVARNPLQKPTTQRNRTAVVE